MRLIAAIGLILISIVGAGFWTNHALQTSTQELTRQIDQVSLAVKKENWAAAVSQTAQFEKVWKKEAQWWPVVLDHQEMDNIEFSLAKVKEYVSSRNPSLSLGQLSEVKLMIEHIPKKEAVNFENIL
jgi:hypothetical protein